MCGCEDVVVRVWECVRVWGVGMGWYVDGGDVNIMEYMYILVGDPVATSYGVNEFMKLEAAVISYCYQYCK